VNDLVTCTVDKGVATLTLNWPERRNALTQEMAAGVVAACDQVDGDSDVGAAVVRGAAGTFCSGAYRALLDEIGRDPLATSNYRALDEIYQAFVRVGTLRVPTVAAVRGVAVGAGVNLLLATDLRIIARDARIICGFGRIGVHPGGGHFVLAERLAGREATAAMTLFSEEVNGLRAKELGLAWDAPDDVDVEPVAQALALTAAADPELARAMVASFRKELGPPVLPLSAALELERGPQMWSLARKSTAAASA
jgi:enoyl-CoA hydratase